MGKPRVASQNRFFMLCRAFHREEEGQHLVLGILMVVALLMLLMIPLNLAMVTHQKIQTQNAVDAAALAGADWQIRGMSFVQSMNDVIYLCDICADTCIWISVACNYAMGFPLAAPFAWGIGNFTLGVSIASHAVATYILVPFRYLAADYLFPAVCCYAGSFLAHENGATSLAGIGTWLERLSLDISVRVSGKHALPNVASSPAADGPWDWLSSAPIYAVGVEVSEDDDSSGVGLVGLHLMSTSATKWPLKVTTHTARLKNCALLQPAHAWAETYFSAVGKWEHAYYESDDGLAAGSHSGVDVVELPPQTWVAVMREEDRGADSRYNAWTSLWRSTMGGLGVVADEGWIEDSVHDTQEKGLLYGELGSLGLASSQAIAERVRMVSFVGLQGWVQMTPVNLPGVDALDLGICH